MSRQPTAAWPLKSLLRSLTVSGWGVLAGAENRGARCVLSSLCDMLPNGSGEGLATAWQIAASASYSQRHTRRALHILEDLGIISWTRGGIVDGRPQPSFFRVCKKKLVELIQVAKHTLRERRNAHQEETRSRCTSFKKTKVFCSRRSRHADMASSLSSLNRGGRSPHPDGEYSKAELLAASYAAKAAAQNAEAERNVNAIAQETGLSGMELVREVLRRKNEEQWGKRWEKSEKKK